MARYRKGLAPSFSWLKIGKAKLIANPTRVTTERAFMFSLGGGFRIVCRGWSEPDQLAHDSCQVKKTKLLAGEDPHNPGSLDTHPLVREYFGEQLRGQRMDAWKESNRRVDSRCCVRRSTVRSYVQNMMTSHVVCHNTS
jgi:hypothetical protein